MIQENGNIELKNWELVSVNPSDKKWDWTDLFCFWGNNIQTIIGFSLIASLYLVYNLNFLVVLFGCLIGSFFVYLFVNLIGKPSQRHGIPFPVFLRISMGINGARYVSLFRGLVGIFMFGVQTYFLSKSFSYLIRIGFHLFDNTILDQDIFLIFFLGLNIIDWTSIIIAIVLQIILFSLGMNFNKKIINFSAVAVYTGMLLFFFSVLLSDVKFTYETFINSLNYTNVTNKDNLIPLVTVAGTIFAYFSIVILSFGDFSRYVKNENELKKGNLSLILNLIIFSFFALFIVVGVDGFLKQNSDNLSRILTNPTDIIGSLNNLLTTNLALIFIIIASLSTNLIANFIPSQYTLINLMPSTLSLKSSSFIISILGFIIGIFWLTFLSQVGVLSFIDTFGAFFGPLFGIIVADYYLIQKENLSNKDLYSDSKDSSYYYSGGWHLKGIYSLVIGFIFSASTIWNTNLMFLQSYAWIIGAFVSWITYYLLAKK